MSSSQKKQTAFRLDPEILEGLLAVKERDGMPLAEQVRRALRTWLEGKNVTASKGTGQQRRAKSPVRRK